MATINDIAAQNSMEVTEARKVIREKTRAHRRNSDKATGQSIATLFGFFLAWLADLGEDFSRSTPEDLVKLAVSSLSNAYNRTQYRAIGALYFCGKKSAERIAELVDEFTCEIATKALWIATARDLVGKLFKTFKAIDANQMRQTFGILDNMLDTVESRAHAIRSAIRDILTGQGYTVGYIADTELDNAVDWLKELAPGNYAPGAVIEALAGFFSTAKKKEQPEAPPVVVQSESGETITASATTGEVIEETKAA